MRYRSSDAPEPSPDENGDPSPGPRDEESFDAEDLVRRVRGGDMQAIAELFEKYKDLVRHAVRRRLGQARRAAVDSEDIQMRTIESFLQNLEGFTYRGPGSLRAYLGRIAENHAIDELRRRGTRKRSAEARLGLEALRGLDGTDSDTSIADAGESPSQELMRREELEQLEHRLGRLPERERQVVELYIRRLSWSQIAERLAFPSEGAARMCFRRAKFRMIAGGAEED